MRLFEHEGLALLREAGVPVATGSVVESPEEASAEAQLMGLPVVLKVQIPLGGRGKAGGVRVAGSPEAARATAEALLQTEIRGHRATQLLVQQYLEVAEALFVAATYDPTIKRPTLLASISGGVNVEDHSERVLHQPFSAQTGLATFQARELAIDLGYSGRSLLDITGCLVHLAGFFLRYDALLAEINPLVRTPDGRLVAVDAHVELDDDALFRHPDLVERFDLAARADRPQSEFERRAAEIDASDHRGVAGRMVAFDGDLGLLVGGGGASITVFDALLDAGARPANYCEIGGNPSVLKIKELTRLILSQPKVQRLAVIMNVVSNTRVDLIARGVIKGIIELGQDPAEVIAAFRVPGSWEDEGRIILERYGVRTYSREVALDEVARQVANR